jgi:AmiR/NasT family two-component response regulator
MTQQSSRRLLIVDDDAALADTLARTLGRAGHAAVAVNSADDALASLTSLLPDLVILDVRMPGWSGLKLSGVLREQFGVPFMFLSGASDTETVQEATAQGALAYLVKPMDLAQCVPSVNAALARADELRGLRRNESQLTTALQQSRAIATAIGVVMERLQVDRQVAFETLRDRARSERRRINEVAEEILLAAEQLSRLTAPPVRRKDRVG